MAVLWGGDGVAAAIVGQGLFPVNIDFYTSQQMSNSMGRLDDPIHDTILKNDLLSTGWAPLGLVLVVITVTGVYRCPS